MAFAEMGAVRRLREKVAARVDTRRKYNEAADQSRERGGAAELDYLSRARAYDPYAAVERSAQGVWGNLAEDVREQFADLTGSQAAVGRLRTGYAEKDHTDLMRRATDRLQNSILSQSMDAARLDLANMEGIGGYGERTTGRYLDLLSGEMDRQQAEQNAKRQQSASRWGVLGTIGGYALGGPIGAAIGKKIGG